MKDNNYMGFDSVSDFFVSITRFKDWTFNIIPVMIASITSFITGYVWDTPEAIWTLWILMLADYATGIWKSMVKKKFVSYKLFRMPVYFVVTSFTLAISWWLAKSSVFFFPLPSLVYGGFAGVYIISLLENFGELGYLPKPLVRVLKQRFGLKAIIDKWELTHPTEVVKEVNVGITESEDMVQVHIEENTEINTGKKE